MFKNITESIRTKFEETSNERSATPEVISFTTLRRAVGWLGILLPVVLVIGSFLFDSCRQIQPSISHYYFTNMREIFAGVLCAVSLFLFSYKGYSRADNLSANTAGLFSLGVAFFPTDVLPNYPCQKSIVSLIEFSRNATVHFTSAALFFITLAYMSIFLFTKSKHTFENQTREKKQRNLIYRVCGYIMVFSILVIAASKPLFGVGEDSQIVFWFETLALMSFGLSWLTKGEALFADGPTAAQ